MTTPAVRPRVDGSRPTSRHAASTRSRRGGSSPGRFVQSEFHAWTYGAAAPYVQAWNSDWTNRPGELPPLRERVDAACLDVGRDPSTLGRTAGVVIDLPVRDPARDGRA